MNNIVITGGGTGGHLSVAKAFKDELNKRGIYPIFIGSTSGQDRDWFENEDGFSKKYFLESKGVVNQKGFKKIKSLLDILKLSNRCKEIFKENSIKAVISVGGYSAAPASLASIFLKTPLFIHEQNAIKGRLNEILTPFAKRVFCSFLPPFDPYPTRDIFFQKKRVRSKIKRVIFLGGSQGAVEINDFALNVAKELNYLGIEIIHQSGKRDFKRVKKAYETLGIKVNLFDFDKNIVDKIQKADFAISRAGASTLWELAANALPTLFFPYPYAAKNHQEANARFLVDKKAAFLFEKERRKEKFLKLLKKDISTYSQNLINLTKKDGAKKIVDEILNPNIIN